MKVLQLIIPLLSLCVPAVQGGHLPGPSYPAPRDVGSDTSRVSATWKNVTTTLDQTIQGEGLGKLASALLKNTTFSIGMFSLHDQNALSLQYHHTAPTTLNGTYGAKKVDADTIYRVASVSKLITTYAGMIKLNDNDWNTPLADIFPAFKKIVEKTAEDFDAVQNIQWDKITVADIAAQLGGIPRLSIPISSDLAITGGVDPSTLDAWGLPPVNLTEIVTQYPCAASLQSGSGDCDTEMFTQGMASNQPLYQPAASPLYSDSGFFLLGGCFV